MRELLRKTGRVLGSVGVVVWRLVSNTIYALWEEIHEGAGRASWWLLVGLVWLDGMIAALWLF